MSSLTVPFRPSDIATGLQGYWKLDEASGSRADSSPNGNTLTDNNTVASLAQDYWNSGENSADFESSNSEYLSITDGAQVGLDITGAFTISAWVKPESITGALTYTIASKYGAAGQRSFGFWILDSSPRLGLQLSNDGTAVTNFNYTLNGEIAVGKWSHVAAVYDGSFVTLYINGNAVLVTAYSSGIFNSTADFVLGASVSPVSNFMDGLEKDTAVWNVALTPLQIKSLALGIDLDGYDYRPDNVSTAPTEWWKMNELSSGAGAVTRVGSIAAVNLTDNNTVTTLAGFIEAAGARFTAANSEYLSLASNAIFNIGTADFSVSVWVKKITSGENFIYSMVSNSNFSFDYHSVSGGRLDIGVGGTTQSITFPERVGTWGHFAIVRRSGIVTVYVDGVAVGSAVQSGSVTQGAINFGTAVSPANYHDGLMADFGYWNGYALTDAEIASLASGIPIQQSGIISYWGLDELSGTRFDSIGANDLTDNNTVANSGKIMTANGNAQIDTDQSIFGGASGLFDGTGDYIETPDHADWNFGSGDFTIETRLRFASVTGTRTIVAQNQDGTHFWALYWDGSNIQFEAYNGSQTHGMTFAWSPATNTWYHVALCRIGNSWKCFVDGVQIGSTVTDSDALIDLSGTLQVGAYNGTSTWNGWLDEMRISKGIARYTDDFTTPAEVFIADKFTTLLLHFDGTDASTSFIESSGGVIDLGADFEASNSEYLSITDGAQSGLDLTRDLTILAFVKLETVGTSQVVVDKAGLVGAGYTLLLNSSNQIQFSINAVGLTGATALSASVWAHIAGVYDGAAKRDYLNSAQDASASASTNPANSTDEFRMGVRSDTLASYLDGLLDEVIVATRWFRDEEIKAVYNKGLNGKEATSVEVEPDPTLGTRKRGMFATFPV